ncbi:MAG TPA: transcriptional regulator [Chlorobaculum parvum]|uniref:Transcriptional regulator n=1 Tax=Chlorobaculum parvum TaxID=274539 RepID=A0A7C5DFF4_9CHLB|nr:transcriptional regulator [Chlorobaculum parvum]
MSPEPSKDKKDYNHQLLDKVIYARIRFAALAYLMSVSEASFVEIRDSIRATDGNLSIHLRKLEAAGYVECHKTFESRKPLTNFRVTDKGREAFEQHFRNMEMFSGGKSGLQLAWSSSS